MGRMRRWDGLAVRVYEQFAQLLRDLYDKTDINSVDGDFCVQELIGIIASGQALGARDWLEIETDAKPDLEVVIGLDISGSTCVGLGDDGVTVLDVEKAFTLIFGHAMQMLTKNVSCYAFNSESSTNVYKLETIDAVSGLTSDLCNRDGDFIRYITGVLAGSAARRKYFILISDGQPAAENYYGKDALEDTLIAMRECRDNGIQLVYCNIDSKPQDYFHLMGKEAAWAANFSHPEDLLREIGNLAATITKGCA